MAVVQCEVPDCPDHLSGREFANEGALRLHGNAKHGTDAGTCLECDPPREFNRLSLHRAKAHPVFSPGPSPGVSSAPADGQPAAAPPAPPGAEEFVEEVVPGGITPTPPPPGPTPRPRLRDRVRKSVWGATPDTPGPASVGNGSSYDAPAAEGGRKAKAPRAAARVNTSDIGSLVWGGLGAGLEKTGIDVPVGRCMKFQAPMAGAILDEWWARTWFDRIVLQRIAPRMDDTEKLGALLLLPVLVAVAERSPEGQAFGPLLGQVIQANLVHMAPVVKKQRADAKKLADAMRDLDMGLPEGVDPIQAIADMIFAPPPGVPTDEPGPTPPPQADGVTAPL